MTNVYTLHVIRVEDVHWDPKRHSRVPNLYVEVRLDNPIGKTRAIRDKVHTWNETLTFPSADASASLSVAVFHKSAIPGRKDVSVGSANVQLSELSRKCANGPTKLALQTPTGKSYGKPSLVVQLLDAPIVTSDIEHDVKAATQASRELEESTTALGSIEKIVTQSSAGSDLYKSIWALSQKVDILVNIIDKLSGLHPYLNAAWQLTSALYKAISHQIETDNKLVDLVHAMEDAFDFVTDTELLPDKTRRLKQTIDKLLQQTVECCRFVLHYTNHNFPGRMLQMSLPKINEFTERFVDLKRSLDLNISLQTAFVSARVSEKIDDIYFKELLNPYDMNAFNRGTCLEDTRVELLNKIMDWLLSDAAQNTLWLHGVAGSGKSTVATTIAEFCRDMGRLGAFLFFRRADGGEDRLSSIFRTISFQLALFDSAIARNIGAAIKQGSRIAEAVADVQFRRLVLDPLSAAKDEVQGPVVIIIDALDECGTPEARRSLLSLLKRDFGKLPSNFRFLITSRPEADINAALSNRPNFVYEVALNSSSANSRRDVLRFIDYEMRRIIDDAEVTIPDDWPWNQYMNSLSAASEGLFIWASTAIRMVSDNDNPFRKLKELVNNSYLLKGLDQLYASVLTSSGISWAEASSRTRFMQVLGLILFSKSPLSDTTIDAVLGFPSDEPSHLILSKLRSVLIFKRGEPVHLLHTSFADYLISSQCSDPCSTHRAPTECINGPWFLDIPPQKMFIATRCFVVMETSLRFNLCDLETSFAYNSDVSGLEISIKRNIPPHLEYACIYWAQHLLDVPFTSCLMKKLTSFAHERLLYWFEVLSVLNQFGRVASRSLLDSATWIETRDAETFSFLSDGSRLASIFSAAVTQSTPHIYVSMLPLMKEESEVAAHYSRRTSSMVSMERIGKKSPPLWLKVLEGHTGATVSVAFSPDGKRIVSGSLDKCFRVWDAENGEVVLEQAHPDAVSSVAFSADGKCIVSGCGDGVIRLWNAESGEATLGPLRGHSDNVYEVAFSPAGTYLVSRSRDRTIRIWDITSDEIVSRVIEGPAAYVYSVAFSPDGKHIVAGLDDRIVKVWDVKTGQIAYGPFEVHTDDVVSVAFSPDGKCVASASRDKTIRIWDVMNGETVCGPLTGHSSFVWCICFSPDGRLIVSGSADSSLLVWDVTSGEVISGPLEGHTGVIGTVAFSPDGTRIVSGSSDGTVRIWNARTGKVMQGRTLGHTNDVLGIAYSPKGTHVVSGSRDKTVRIWDIRKTEIVPKIFAGHSSDIPAVTFSPNGQHVASGSYDGTIIIWDTESGATVAGPFKGHSESVHSVAFSPDGTRIASSSSDKTIKVWDASNGNALYSPFEGHTASVIAVAFSPDGECLASGSRDTTVMVWNAKSGQIVSGPFKRHGYSVNSVAFSPDGKCIVSGSADKTIVVWDRWTGEIVCGPLEGHTSQIWSVCFSPNGTRIASGCWDSTVRIWDAKTGKIAAAPFIGHADSVVRIAFSPDGTRIASCSQDRTIRIWNTEERGIVCAALQTSSTSSVNTIDGKGDIMIESNGNDHVSTSDWTVSENGWILGPQRELLLWVPPDIRPTLWRPRNTAVFSCAFSTKLDFRNVAHGRRWRKCFDATA